MNKCWYKELTQDSLRCARKTQKGGMQMFSID